MAATVSAAAAVVNALNGLTPELKRLIKSATGKNNTEVVLKSLERLPKLLLTDRLSKAIENWDEISGLDMNTAMEIYADGIKYLLAEKVEENELKSIYDNLEKLLSESKPNIDQQFGQSSRFENNLVEREIQVREVSQYRYYVFNRKRVIRLFSVHGLSINCSCANIDEEVERSSDEEGKSQRGCASPHHFLIGSGLPELDRFGGNNNIFNGSKKGERMCTCRFLVQDATDGTIPKETLLCSLIYLGKRFSTLNLGTRQFFLLRSLSLRNVNLTNEDYLNKLKLLRYLDLKHSDVRHCDWLNSLEELEMLDLRGTNVKEIPEECVGKLEKLKWLLLGYRTEGTTKLIAAEFNNQKLMKTNNMKTLRTITWPDKLTHLNEVTDLSVAGQRTQRQMEAFWAEVNTLKHLTSLGVAMDESSTLELQHCRKDLKRLRLEVKSGSPTLSELAGFTSLVDLTLASTIEISSIPSLPSLLCLRLYGVCNKEAMEFEDRPWFENLKKLVIGDMELLKKIEISIGILRRATLKLCNLPKFQELHPLGSTSPFPFLRVRERPGQESQGEPQQVQSDRKLKTIFLKGFQNCCVDASSHMEIYSYDM